MSETSESTRQSMSTHARLTSRIRTIAHHLLNPNIEPPSVPKIFSPFQMHTMAENHRDHHSHAYMPYLNCRTKIVDLKSLDLPESASDEEYRSIYNRYIHQTNADSDANAKLLRDAIESIKYGIAPPVAFPTETVYGLGADATNEPAVAGIFAAKGRPSDNPLIVHVASIAHLQRLRGQPLPEVYRELVKKFWPGPLTILLPVYENSPFAKNVHPGQPTIGFRIPESKYARFFIAATDRPIAGPSANSSGKPSPTTAQHVTDDMNGKINFILDGGSCDVGVESTVVDGLHDPPLILRPGGVSQQALIAHGKEFSNNWSRTAIGYKTHDLSVSTQSYDLSMNGAPRAPGMKYRHYAPKGRLIIFSEKAVANGHVTTKLEDLCSVSEEPLKIGVLSCRWPEFAGISSSSSSSSSTPDDTTPQADSQNTHNLRNQLKTATFTMPNTKVQHTIYDISIGPNISDLAHSVFGVLRLFDDLNCNFIFAEAVDRHRHRNDPNNVVDAVADRLDKAASERIDA